VLRDLFSSELFMPRGHCYLWKTSLVALDVVSSALAGFACLAVAVALGYLGWRARGRPFRFTLRAAGAFFLGSGLVHLLGAWVIWTPVYWIEAVLRAATALAAGAVAIGLLASLRRASALLVGAENDSAARQR
jgi:hypothetical protein